MKKIIEILKVNKIQYLIERDLLYINFFGNLFYIDNDLVLSKRNDIDEDIFLYQIKDEYSVIKLLLHFSQ